MSSKHVIIAGGGLMGCAIAWKLAARGATVHVIESSRPGMAASWAAAGMLAPLLEAHHDSLRILAAESIARFPAFSNELHAASGIDVELQISGKIDVAYSEEDLHVLRARYGKTLPPTVRELSQREVSAIEPAITDSAHGVLVSPHDGSVDTRKLARAAWVAATNAGVQFTSGSSVREVICNRTGVEAVVLSTGERLKADAIVIAAGAWSSSIRGLPGPLPVFPVRGQIVLLEAIPRVLSHIVMTMDCYIVPRTDGRVLIGSTLERAGFETRTTAKGVAHLLNAAIRAVPVLAEAAVLDSWAGLRPGTSDDLPILGEDPRMSGIFYATGHYRNGILLAPITADLTADAVLGTAPIVDMRAFSAARFHG